MPRVCFYISSHGFGHATRAIAVIAKIPAWIDVDVITSAPKWLFERSIPRPFRYRELCHDPGIVQFDCLHADVESTYACWSDLLNRYPQMAKEEAEFYGNEAILIVGDISPFAAAVARETGSPCLIIANFSWDWIFTSFLKYNSNFQEIIDQIASYFQETTLLMRTPLAGDLSVFPNIVDIPLIVRMSPKSREHARKELGLENEHKSVLISFGGHDFEHVPVERLASHPEIVFMTFNQSFLGPSNVRFLDPYVTYHPDAIRATDLALTKMGYGIVTECIGHQVPIAYPPREDFPEHDILVIESQNYIPVLEIAANDFFSGEWIFLDTLLSDLEGITKKEYPRAEIDGAEKAVKILKSYIK